MEFKVCTTFFQGAGGIATIINQVYNETNVRHLHLKPLTSSWLPALLVKIEPEISSSLMKMKSVITYNLLPLGFSVCYIFRSKNLNRFSLNFFLFILRNASRNATKLEFFVERLFEIVSIFGLIFRSHIFFRHTFFWRMRKW